MTAGVEVFNRYEAAKASLRTGDFRAVFEDNPALTLDEHRENLPAYWRMHKYVSAIAGTDPASARIVDESAAEQEDAIYQIIQGSFQNGLAMAGLLIDHAMEEAA